jgi:hypothetical protein
MEESGMDINMNIKDNWRKSAFDYILDMNNERNKKTRKETYQICNQLLGKIDLAPSQYQQIYDGIMLNFHKGLNRQYTRLETIEDRQLGYKVLIKILNKVPNKNKQQANSKAFETLIHDPNSETIMQDSELSDRFYKQTVKYRGEDLMSGGMNDFNNIIIDNKASAFKFLFEKRKLIPGHVPTQYGDSANVNNWTLLHIAVEAAFKNTQGGYEILDFLIGKANTPEAINKPDKNGWTPLMLAVQRHGNQESRLRIFQIYLFHSKLIFIWMT